MIMKQEVAPQKHYFCKPGWTFASSKEEISGTGSKLKESVDAGLVTLKVICYLEDERGKRVPVSRSRRGIYELTNVCVCVCVLL